MNRKALDTFVDGIVDEICTKNGLNPATSAKKGEREAAHALLRISLAKHRANIVNDAGSPGPALKLATS